MIRTAFRANLIPAVILWGFALSLLLLYTINPATRAALDSLSQLKNALGLAFVMPAQALAGGVMPFLFQKLQTGDHRRTALNHVPYLMLFWSLDGIMVDGFYTLQSFLFGNNSHAATIILKVAVDMLIFTPFVAIPILIAAFEWKDAGFSAAYWKTLLARHWFRDRVFPVYIAALMVWAPTVSVLYALPLALQFPIQAIVQCFWGLILVIMTAKNEISSH